MAIQMRRGFRKDFDPSKMLSGEWAVAIDPETQNQIVWMCFAPNVVKRIGTFEDLERELEPMKEACRAYSEDSLASAEASAESARASQGFANDSKDYADESREHADDSEAYAMQSMEYALGETNSSKYYYEESKAIAETLQVAFKPQGTITFEELPPITERMVGFMWNISNKFTSDERFKDGSGKVYPEGTNCYVTSDLYFDCLSGQLVTSVNGQKGDVELLIPSADGETITMDEDGTLHGSKGNGIIPLTQAEYDALPKEEQDSGDYHITDAEPEAVIGAQGVRVNTTDTIFQSNNVQGVVEEVSEKLDVMGKTIPLWTGTPYLISNTDVIELSESLDKVSELIFVLNVNSNNPSSARGYARFIIGDNFQYYTYMSNQYELKHGMVRFRFSNTTMKSNGTHGDDSVYVIAVYGVIK